MCGSAEVSNMATTSTSGNPEMQNVFETGRVDRLSSLPDPILAHILSFLPTEDAAKSVLLRVFGSLWTSIRTLDFNAFIHSSSLNHPKDIWFLSFVDRVLLHHQSPTIDKFCLNFCYASVSEPYGKMLLYSNPCTISRNLNAWIDFATKKKVKVLVLDMLDHNLYGPLFSYELPDFALTSPTVTDLKLVSCALKPTQPICMRSLKTLSLTSIFLSDLMIEEILSGCPLVENLFIITCPCLNKLELGVASLKNLEVYLGEGESSEFKISCPSLGSLKIEGSIGRANLKNATSVVNASLDFFHGGRYSNNEYCKIGLLLEELSHAKFLALCDWCILVLAIWELSCRAFSSPHRKKVNLKTRLTKWHLLGIASLLKNSPTLEFLTLHIEPNTPILSSDDYMWLEAMGIWHNNCWNNPMWLKSYDFSEDIFWNSQPQFPCLKTHLRSIRIHGCIKNPGLMLFVKFLLRSSAVLEKMAFSFSPHQNQMEFARTLDSFPKASNKAEFVFL